MPVDHLSDEELLDLLQRQLEDPEDVPPNAENAFNELYTRYYKQAYSFCCYYGLRHNDVVEAIQECFVKLFSYAHSFKKGGRFKPWFFTILYNQIKNRYQYNQKVRYENVDDYAEILGRDSELINSVQNKVVLNGIMNRLPKQMREVIVMAIYQDMDFEAMGKAWGVTSRYMRIKLDDALAEFKRLAGDHYE